MAEERRSSLSEDEVEELARKVLGIVCDEEPSLGNKLDSSAIYDRIIEEGVELPDYALHDAFDRLRRLITYFLGGPQNPGVDVETVRRHGGITIVGVSDPDLCNEV